MGYKLIKNGLLVDSEWVRREDLLIEGEKIVLSAVGIDESDLPRSTEIFDASGLYVLPGIIDAHTHYHLVSRGTVTADSFSEASRLASFGGVTTVVDFADDDKMSLSSSLKKRKEEMSKMAIDYALHQGVYKYRDSLESEIKEIASSGVKALKIFTTYKDVGYLVEKRDELKKIFFLAKRNDMIVCVHAEDNEIIEKTSAEWRGTYLAKDHPDLRPSVAEKNAIEYVGSIAEELGMDVYIVHLSSKSGLEAVRALRRRGARIIVETVPHYLFLNRKYLEGDNGPLYVMTPPLREEQDNEALRGAVENGEVQVIATDHCAFTREQKLENPDVRKTYPGIPGSEELLPLTHTFFCARGKLTICNLVNLLSTSPAKKFGLYPLKGSLKTGSDADIVIFDPDEKWQIKKESVHSASGYTAYDGFSVIGKVKRTYLRGNVIMSDGVYFGKDYSGRYIKRVR